MWLCILAQDQILTNRCVIKSAPRGTCPTSAEHRSGLPSRTVSAKCEHACRHTPPCTRCTGRLHTKPSVTKCISCYLCSRSKTDSLCPLSVLETARSRSGFLVTTSCTPSASDGLLSERASRLLVSVPALGLSVCESVLSGGL